MPLLVEKSNIITINAKVRPESKDAFIDWQSELNALIAAFPGFVSLEILAPADPSQAEWAIVQRFCDNNSASLWCASAHHKELLKTLTGLAIEDGVKEVVVGESGLKGGVTEVFVTQVNKEKQGAFREWIAKIHHVEAKFPGFRGVYVQSPTQAQGKNWITFLQFDTPENLDRWLVSKEREEVLRESKSLIASIESQRVISSYAGWFSSLEKLGGIPPAWKQTMVVLLVLFPIVMLELKFLTPVTESLNSSLATFISNALSVTLISWPMMPIAVYLLGWWLVPQGNNSFRTTIAGAFLVFALYALEVAILWHLL